MLWEIAGQYQRKYSQRFTDGRTVDAWLGASAAVWFCTIAFPTTRARRTDSTRLTPLNLLVLGTALALAIGAMPTALAGSTSGVIGTIEAILMSLYAAIQAFSSTASATDLLEGFRGAQGLGSQLLYLITGLIHVSAPLLLIAAVVSFFQTPTATVRYFWRRNRDAFVFSELNEQSIAVAESIRASDKRSTVVFTGVVLSTRTPSAELIDRAKEIGAVFFKSNILAAPLHRRSENARIQLFILGNDEATNAWVAVDVLEKSRLSVRDRTDMYVFSTTVEGDLAFMSQIGRAHV